MLLSYGCRAGQASSGLRRTGTRTPTIVGNCSPGQDYRESMHVNA